MSSRSINLEDNYVRSAASKASGFLRKYVDKRKDSSRKKNSVDDLAELGYEVGYELGEGSYCKVKSAVYNEKKIAVKIITRKDLSVDFESRFLPREIEILCSVKHKNIIHVYNVYSYPRRVFIFMELMTRGDLLAYIRSHGRLMEGEACHFFHQVVSGLQYLHEQKIAHRDIKCENVMIGDNDVVKLVDFGFSRYTVNEEGQRVLSQTYCGSTAYAAPEVLQGIPYNPMFYDIWSLGCVLFIMITGTMPFDDSNVRKMVTSQIKKRINYPSTFAVNKKIKDLISRMLEPDVVKRANIKQVANCKWINDHKQSRSGLTSGTSTSSNTRASRINAAMVKIDDAIDDVESKNFFLEAMKQFF